MYTRVVYYVIIQHCSADKSRNISILYKNGLGPKINGIRYSLFYDIANLSVSGVFC